MTKRQQKDYLKGLEKYKKEVTSTRKKAQEFLIRAGIHDKGGQLSKNYQ